MPIDPSVIRVQPIEQPDLLGSIGKVMAYKHMAQQGQMQDVEIQQHQIALQQAQQDQKDQQTLMQAMAQVTQQNPNATMRDVLPLISGRVSPKTIFAIQKQDLDAREKLAKIHTDELGTLKFKTDQYTQLLKDAQSIPPDQWAAAWPQVRAKAMELSPDGKLQLPEEPVPQQMLPLFGIGLRTTEQAIAQEAEKRAQAEEARKVEKFPVELNNLKTEGNLKAQDLATKQRTDAAAQLGAVGSKEQYAQLWGELPAKVAQYFPRPDQFDPKTTPGQVRQLGMTAEQQTTAQETAKRDAETARNNRSNNSARWAEVEIQRRKFDADEGAIDRTAKAIAGGELTSIKDIASLRGDQRLKIYDKIKTYNPNFNMTDLKNRIKMEEYYDTGKGSDNLRSFGTFLEHVGGAMDATSQIRLSSSPAINKPLNWWRANMSGDPALVRLEAAIEPAKKEYESFLLGGHALQQTDRQSADRILNAEKFSPAQIEEALKTIAHVAQARFNEENFKYKRVSGHDLQDPFSPEAVQGAAKVGLKIGSAPAQTTGGVEKWDFVNGKLTKVGGK